MVELEQILRTHYLNLWPWAKVWRALSKDDY